SAARRRRARGNGVRGTSPDGSARIPRRLRERAAPLGGGAAAGALLGGLLGGGSGLVPGALLGAGAAQWRAVRRSGSAAPPGGSEADPSDIALCADLMAACLAAGATPGEAAGAVGDCMGGSLGAALTRVQAELRLGAEPAECWLRLGRLAGAHEMARCLARASTTGSAPVAEMARLAADIRAAHGRSALARARKAAVLATAPLGVCFLPAFLLVGVAPVVMGLARSVLGGAMT
ncbi:type II secretion system F family protein, partial [Actinacidiphila rubida]|uniref:type II secretion system F family protein n=1 Tax=Actinacidiphila rubida TaxID=310780 RepID=UPI000849837C